MQKIGKTKTFSTGSVATLALIGISVGTAIFACFNNTPTASALSDDQTGAISQRCGSLKQSLKTLQKTDARTRSYLGSAYETALSTYIAPLNLRLINTNQPNASLTNLHSTIIDTRKDFISEYTSYSQSLEELIATDCQGDPDSFYEKLIETREKRAKLSATTTNLRNLLSEYLTDVRKLKNNLGDSTDARS